MKIGRLLVCHRVVVGDWHDPYLVRHIFFSHPKLLGLMLHHLRHSDPVPDLHDHGWWFISLIFWAGYGEESNNGYHFHWPGTILYRPTSWRHRILIYGKPAWSLVLRGPRVREWGYWPKGRWCWWRKYDWKNAVCEDGVIHTEPETNGN
jgi:hypothetical protein